MTLEEKINRLTTDQRRVVEEIVDILLNVQTEKSGIEAFKMLRGSLKDLNEKDIIELQHKLLEWFDEEIPSGH